MHCCAIVAICFIDSDVTDVFTRCDFLVLNGCLAMQAVAGTLDGILDTVSAKHDLALYLALLKVNGVIVMLGVPDEPLDLPLFNIIMRKPSASPLLHTLLPRALTWVANAFMVFRPLCHSAAQSDLRNVA